MRSLSSFYLATAIFPPNPAITVLNPLVAGKFEQFHVKAVRPAAPLLMLLVGCSGSTWADPRHSFGRYSAPQPFVVGAAAPMVLKAIHAAEAGDRVLFDAQFSKHGMGDGSKIELMDLRPACLLNAVTQDSPILVTAKWICRAGKVDAIATRGFLISHGKIAAITGEPIPEYHFVAR